MNDDTTAKFLSERYFLNWSVIKHRLITWFDQIIHLKIPEVNLLVYKYEYTSADVWLYEMERQATVKYERDGNNIKWKRFIIDRWIKIFYYQSVDIDLQFEQNILLSENKLSVVIYF